MDYDSFDVDWVYFRIVANNVKYSADARSTVMLQNALPSVDILKGGKATGEIVFEIPSGTPFTLQYDGLENYNIQWIKQ